MRHWVLMLGIIMTIRSAAAAELPFEDVPRGHWAYEAVQLSARLGMFEGFDGYRAPLAVAADLSERSPAERARAQMKLVSDQTIPATVLPAAGIRPRLLNPMAERFAQEFERGQRLRREAEELRLPPAPESLPRPPARSSSADFVFPEPLAR